MKLSGNSLRDMVKDILNEEKAEPFLPFPRISEEDEPTVEEAEDALDEDQDIIRFFENQDEDGEGKEVLDEHELSLADVVQEEIANFIESKKKNNSELVLEFECKKLAEEMTESRENFLAECERLDEGKMADLGHLTLDVIGLIPGVGSAADSMNAIWYAQEGRPTLAALSAVAAIPGVGMAAGAAKIGKSLKTLFKAAKNGKAAMQGGKVAGKVAAISRFGRGIRGAVFGPTTKVIKKMGETVAKKGKLVTKAEGKVASAAQDLMKATPGSEAAKKALEVMKKQQEKLDKARKAFDESTKLYKGAVTGGVKGGMKEISAAKKAMAEATEQVNKMDALARKAKPGTDAAKTAADNLVLAKGNLSAVEASVANITGQVANLGKLEKKLASWTPATVSGDRVRKAMISGQRGVSDFKNMVSIPKKFGGPGMRLGSRGLARFLDEPENEEIRNQAVQTVAAIAGGPAAVAMNPGAITNMAKFGKYMQNRQAGNVPVTPQQTAAAGADALASVMDGLPPDRQRIIYDAYYGKAGGEYDLAEQKSRSKKNINDLLQEDPLEVIGKLVPIMQNLGWDGIAKKLVDKFVLNLFGKKKK